MALVPRKSPLGPEFRRVTHFCYEPRIAPAGCALKAKGRASDLDVKAGESRVNVAGSSLSSADLASSDSPVNNQKPESRPPPPSNGAACGVAARDPPVAENRKVGQSSGNDWKRVGLSAV